MTVEMGRTKHAVAELSFFLYDRALHPELFRIDRSQTFSQPFYHASVWIAGLSHVVTVHSGQWSLTELVAVESDLLPDRGLLTSFPFRGERDHDVDFASGRHYIVSSQVERMTEHLFRATYKDLVRTGRNRGMFASFEQWASNGLAPFIYLDCEARRTELHVQAFHVFPDDLTVLKTQSIFEATGRERGNGGRTRR